MDMQFWKNEASYGEYAVYFTVFSCALYFGGVRFWLIPSLLLLLIAAFILDVLLLKKSRVYLFARYGKQFPLLMALLFILTCWMTFRGLSFDNWFDGISWLTTWLTGVLVLVTTLTLSPVQARRERSMVVLFCGVGLLSLAHFLISYRGMNPRAPFVYFLFHGFHYHGFVIQVVGFGLMMMLLLRRYSSKTWLIFTIPLIELLSLVYYGKSGAFSGLLVLLSVTILLLLQKAHSQRVLLIIVIVLLLFVNVLVILGMDSILSELSTLSKSDEMSRPASRWIIYKGTFQMFTDHVISGVGTGKFAYAYPLYRDPRISGSPYYAHSDPLQLLAENGIVGGIVLLLIIVLASRYVIINIPYVIAFGTRNRYNWFRKTDVDQAFLMGTFAGLLAVIGISITDFEFHIPANLFLFFWLCGECAITILRAHTFDFTPSAQTHSFDFRRQPIWSRVLLVIALTAIVVHNGALAIATHNAESAKKIQRKDEDASLRFWKQASQWYPLHHQAWYEQGRIQMTRGRAFLSEAERNLTIATQLARKHPLYLSTLAGVREMQDNQQGALESITEALALDPNNLNFLYFKARLHLQLGEIHSAESGMKQLFELDPPRFSSLIKDIDAGLSPSIEFLTAIAPTTTDEQFVLVDYLLRGNHHEVAAPILDELIMRPLTAKQRLKVTTLLMSFSDLSKTEEIVLDFLKREEFTPDSRESFRLLDYYVKALIANNRTDDAFNLLDHFKIRFPRIANLYILQANVARQAGLQEQQLSLLLEGFTITDDPLLSYEIGRFHQSRGDYLEAFRYYQLATFKDTSNVTFRLGLIDLYIARDMLLQARLACDETLTRYPQHLGVLYRLRRIYELLKLPDKEIDLCEMILALSPEHDLTQKRLQQLQFPSKSNQDSGN